MPKKKIVHIIPNLLKGGAERFVIDLCNALAESGTEDIHLISLYNNDPELSFVKDISRHVHYHELGKRSGLDIRVLVKLQRRLNSIHPDVINTHLNALEYAMAYKLLWGHDTIFFHTLHNDAYKECSAQQQKIRGWLYKKGRIRPITISQESAASYHSCYRQHNDVLIPNGRVPVPPSSQYALLRNKYRLGASSEHKVLVSVGRICEQKNHTLLIDAVETLRTNGKLNCSVLIVGGIQDPVAYEKIRNRGNGWLEFTGEQQNITDYLSLADAFCLPSKFEGMPISLIEAFSVGCIPICTPVGGMKEMIEHGVTGFLSRGMDTEAFQDAILECLHSPNQQALKTACIREFNNKYHISITANNYRSTYEKE